MENKFTNFDNQNSNLNDVIGIKIASKIKTLTPNDTNLLIDAVNIDWSGYKINDTAITYTGELIDLIGSGGNAPVWDEQEYVIFSVETPIYKDSETQPTPLDFSQLSDNDKIDETLFDVDGEKPEGWSKAKSGEHIYKSSIIALYKYYNKDTLDHNIGDIEFTTWSEPIGDVVYLETENIGQTGNFKSVCFTRTNQDISNETPQGGRYSMPCPNQMQYNGEYIDWYDGIPSGDKTIWSTYCIFYGDNTGSTGWSHPQKMLDTADYDVEFAFENDVNPKQKPQEPIKSGEGANCNGSDNQIWYDPILDAANLPSGKDWSDMVWKAEQHKRNGVPGAWVITRIKGETGEAGLKGDFKSTVFTRTSENISSYVVSGGDYSSPIPTNTSYQGNNYNDIVWSDGIPNGNDPIWSTYATFIYGSETNTEWAYPTLMADTPEYDVEFSPYSNSDETAPRTTENIEISDDWFDPTTDLNNVDWTTMVWRAERRRATSFDSWSAWVITKIKGEDGIQGKPADFYQQRYKCLSSDETVNGVQLPSNDIPYSENDSNPSWNGWSVTQTYDPTKSTWMTSRKVTYSVVNSEWVPNYTGSWQPAIKISGADGNGIAASPIQPVMMYTWHSTNDVTTPPNANVNSQNPGDIWRESPNNPDTANGLIFLWMIQGKRQDGAIMPINDNVYWTNPVCLSGPDGEPGKDGDDIEFIYKRFDKPQEFEGDDNPANWSVSSTNNYLGPNGHEWENHPQGVTNINRYEYCSYRRKTTVNGQKQWQAFSEPFTWSIYGENGIDGDGVEYIYTVLPHITDIPTSYMGSTSYVSEQHSDYGVNKYVAYYDSNTSSYGYFDVKWFDEPQTINNDTQKYQWVASRKKQQVTNENKSNLLNFDREPGDNEVLWFPFSTPKLWNWYVNDGTTPDRPVMLYTWHSSYNDAPDTPQRNVNIGGNNGIWFEHPGSPNTSVDPPLIYLWMSSATVNGSYVMPYSDFTGTWSEPVCLSGKDGKVGHDGDNIEFIYFRTGDDSLAPTIPSSWSTDPRKNEHDFPFVGTVGTDYYVSEDGISTLLNKNHDTWTDNPLGVSQKYDYEYASVRHYNGETETWGDFSKPFLWSKWGEDGLDGDGVEYIYYLGDTQPTTNWNNKNPKYWFNFETNGFQDQEYFIEEQGWTDDPSDVGPTNIYEYVSTRNFKVLTSSNYSKITGLNTSYNWYTKQNDDERSYIYSGSTVLAYEGDKLWFPYSSPKLWAKFGVDGKAINLTLESDNDMMAVAIDNNSTREDSTNTATMFLYHNLNEIDANNYDLTFTDTNFNDNAVNNLSSITLGGTTIASITKENINGHNRYEVSITIPRNTSLPQDGSFMFTVCTTMNSNNTVTEIADATRFFTFKVIGLSLSTISQLKTDRAVIRRDIQNTLDPVTVSVFNISNINDTALHSNYNVYAKSTYLENGQYYAFNEFKLNNGNVINKYYPEDPTTYTLSYVDFLLRYEDGSQNILVDDEVVSVVRDGIDGLNGVDGLTDEYIYYLSEDYEFRDVKDDPLDWASRFLNNKDSNGLSYFQYRDFPFSKNEEGKYIFAKNENLSPFKILDWDSNWNTYTYNGWTDNPRGITSTYVVELSATRSYNYGAKQWNSFTSYFTWSTWGHSGLDGDGTEYIFSYVTNSEDISELTSNDTSNPQKWFSMNSDYQAAEYININAKYSNNDPIWYDDLSEVHNGVTLDPGAGFAVSIRNYKELNLNSYNNNIKPLGTSYIWYNGSTNEKSYLYYKRGTSISQPLAYDGDKIWFPYTEPKLWSSIGKPGPQGNGGSGYIVDFDNNTLVLGVNSNNTIKGDNETYTGIHLYNNGSEISIDSISVNSITPLNTNDNTYFNNVLSSSNQSNVGKTFIGYLYKSGSSYFYKVKTIERATLDDKVILDENGKKIQFKVDASGKSFLKTLNLNPLYYGIDGAPAETFELRIPVAEIHYDTQNNASPTSITPKIWHHKGGDVAPVNELLEKHSNYKFSYIAYLKSGGLQPEYTQSNVNTKLVVSIPNGGNISYITFRLKSSAGNIVDEETTYAVYDGSNGRDSYSDEYLYYRSKTPINWDEQTNNNPHNWSMYNGVSVNSITDFPWSKISDESYLGWTDNPQGVDEEYSYEYCAHRSYNTSSWNTFGKPFIWSHYGETGEDGDGVEYIYKVFSSKQTFSNNKYNPNSYLWFTNSNYQSEFEYIHGDSGWYDNPQPVDGTNKYQYVSARRYKKLTSDSYSSYISNQNYIKNYVTLVGDELKTVSDNSHIAYLNEKIWFPYSTPKLWSSYGDPGIPGNYYEQRYAVIEGVSAPSTPGTNELTVGVNGTTWKLTINESSIQSGYRVWMTFREVEYTSATNRNYKANTTWATPIPMTGLDGVASTVTVDADNDVITVKTLNDKAVAKTWHYSYMYMYDNASPISFTMTGPTGKGFINKTNAANVNSSTTSAYCAVKEGDVTISYYIKTYITADTNLGSDLTYSFTCKTSKDGNEITRQGTIKVIGLNVPTIYEMHVTPNVVRLDPQGELASNQDLSVKVSYIKDNVYKEITTLQELNNNSLYLYVNNQAQSSMSYSVTDKLSSSPFVFDLKWKDASNNYVLMDSETVEKVSDGTIGIDGKSAEYIYYRSQSTKTFSGVNDPSTWSDDINDETNGNFQWDDWPFTYLNTQPPKDYYNNVYSYNGWTDNAQGINGSSYNYEYVAVREFDNSTKRWSKFSKPVPFATWGKSGLDGDGVEYIYLLTDTAYEWVDDGQTYSNYDPRKWFASSGNYQSKDYHGDSTYRWTDNPQSLNDTYAYQYVSTRNYGKYTTSGQYSSTLTSKRWGYFSKPALWNEYVQGAPGTNAFTIDWDNDQINLAVDNLGYVLGSQSKKANLSLYTNDNIKLWSSVTGESSLVLTYSSGFSFNKGLSSTNNRINLAYSITNNSKLTATISTNSISSSNEYTYIPQSGIDLTFMVPVETQLGTYTTVSKVLKVVGQHTAVDGTPGNDAVTYELVPNNNSIIYNVNSGVITPTQISYTIFKHVGNNITVFGGNSICYVSYQFGGSSSNTASVVNCTGSNYPVINSNYANTYSYINMMLNYKTTSASTSWKQIDKETIPIIKSGRDGYGADAFSLEFTNDQVNISVNSSNHVKAQTTRTTTLQLLSENDSLTIDDFDWTTDTENIVISTDAEDFDTVKDLLILSELNDDGRSIDISVTLHNNVLIPDSGIQFYYTVYLDGIGQSAIKAFKICGQVIPDNGTNAITYEIVPSLNSLIYDWDNDMNTDKISYSIIKYDGDNTPTTVSANQTIFVSAYAGGINLYRSLNYSGSGFDLSDIENYIHAAKNTSSNPPTINNTYSYIKINLNYKVNSTTTRIIDSETIPIILSGIPGQKGGEGPQGISGAIVRMCGEYNHTRKYGNGLYSSGSTTSLIFKDIVTYTWANGTTKYYTPTTATGLCSVLTSGDNNLSTGSYYISGRYPASSSGSSNQYWTEATQYDFIATKLLYADQALINSLTTHDTIATDANGYPVAGITSGANKLKDANGTTIEPYLSGQYNNMTVPNANASNASAVRIFAGEIWNEKTGSNSSYSLTYAPFNVRQDGTAYMSKAVIEGDITANTLTLGDGSFAYIPVNATSGIYLPNLGDGSNTRSFYILSSYNGNTSNYIRIGTPKNSGDTINVSVGNTTIYTSSSSFYNYIFPKANTLYQCISIGKVWNIIISDLTSAEPEYRLLDVTDEVTLLGWSVEGSGSNMITRWMDSEEYYDKYNSSSMGWGPKITWTSNNENVFEFYTYFNNTSDPEITGAMCNLGTLYWANIASVEPGN